MESMHTDVRGVEYCQFMGILVFLYPFFRLCCIMSFLRPSNDCDGSVAIILL